MKIEKIIVISLLLLSSLVITCSFLLKNNEETYTTEEILEASPIKNPVSLRMYENLEKYSCEYDIPKYIFYNIAYLETTYRGPFHWNYKPNLTSSAGAVGPMQIMPATANFVHRKTISIKKLKNDVVFNIETSAKLLKHLYKLYGDWSLVCGYYNTGRPIVNQYAKFCISNEDYQKNWLKPNN